MSFCCTQMQNTIRSVCFSDTHTDIVNMCSILSRSPRLCSHICLTRPPPLKPTHTCIHTKKCGVTMNMRATGSYQCFHLGSSLLFLSSSFWLSSPSLHHQVWNMKSAFSNVVDFSLFSSRVIRQSEERHYNGFEEPCFCLTLREENRTSYFFFFFHSFFPYHMSFALSLSHRDPALGSSAWCRICSDYH